MLHLLQKNILCAISVYFFCSTSFAANQNLYQIHLLVFTQISQKNLNSENWPDELLTPNLNHAVELLSDSQNQYQLMPQTDFALNKEASLLEKRSNDQIILKQTWVQPIDNRQGKWVHIVGGQCFDPNGNTIDSVLNTDQSQYCEINGVMSFSKIGYYINVYTRLYLTELKSLLSGKPGDSQIGNYQPSLLRSFKLFEDRRTPINTLNYIDHPLFGVLVKITPYSPPPT